MGAERRVVFDLINVVQGHAKLTQALIRDKRLDTLYLLPASQTRDKGRLGALSKPQALLQCRQPISRRVAQIGVGKAGSLGLSSWRHPRNLRNPAPYTHVGYSAVYAGPPSGGFGGPSGMSMTKPWPVPCSGASD